MAVHILMVIAFRQLTVLAVEAMTAEVIMARRTDAIASPVTIGQNQAVQLRVIGVNATALAHCHMMRRIEAAGADVAPGAGKLRNAVNRILRSECIAVVFNQPWFFILEGAQAADKSNGLPSVWAIITAFVFSGDAAASSVINVMPGGDVTSQIQEQHHTG